MDDQQWSREERERAWTAWMVAAQAGEGSAYEKLLVDLLPYVRRLVARRVGDVSAREDVVQNVFVSIHRARHTYRAERPFAPWLHAIVRNATVDWLRVHARRAGREVSLDAEGVPPPSTEPASPWEQALSPDLERALAALPAAQREAVEMIHLQELSVADAADRAGISRVALRVRAHRGYRALRALLQGQDR